jgi:RNA polymerase sigma factor (sigma-70 family)
MACTGGHPIPPFARRPESLDVESIAAFILSSELAMVGHGEGTVHVVDDDDAVRDSLRVLLETEGFRVETYPRAEEFLERYEGDAEGPECLLVDLRMPGMDGIELCEKLRERQQAMPAVFVTAHGDVPHAVAAMKAGAFDFLEKPFCHEELIRRVREAMEKDRLRRRRERERREVQGRLERLTPREREVLALVTDGATSREIARRLGISLKTVEVHRAHILSKMQASNVAELVRLVVSAQGPEEE